MDRTAAYLSWLLQNGLDRFDYGQASRSADVIDLEAERVRRRVFHTDNAARSGRASQRQRTREFSQG